VHDRLIYHITHKDNLPGIIEARRLWCDSQRIKQGFPCTNIGYSHIKARRLQRKVEVSAGSMLGDYVPFNFCPRSVMLYVIYRHHADYQGGQEPVVHLVSTVGTVIASGRPWAFTDRHAELEYADYADDVAREGIVDWDVMPLTYWSDSPVKEKRQAEFLAHDWFPWSAVLQIGVHDKKIAAEVEHIMANAAHRPTVTVEPAWYY
jgi:ssDNA thymidine ADP-ribosyltransferase, DarT